MHPFLPSSAVLLASAVIATGCAPAQSQPAPPPAAKVEVTPAVFQALRQWDELTGRLEAVDSVDVHARVGGFIDGVQFKEGAKVRKGQVLFQIDPRPFQAEVDRASAQLERAQAQAQLARADADRGQRLMDQNAVAQGELERLQAQAKSAAADVEAARAALQTARLNLSFTRVISPIDGRVSRAVITPGNLITTNDLLTTVVSDGPIYASFNTDEQTYLKYASGERGKPAPVYLGLMTEEGFPHQGKLSFIDNAVDVKSGTINGRALFDNADGKFTPGLFARIKLVSSETQTVALVPERALGTDLGKRYVLVLTADNHVQYDPVTLGPAIGELRVIRSGLKPGDKVVVSGLQKVKPGDPVTPTLSAQPVSTAELASLNPAS
ncbi:MAG: efflux transporter, family, subunit [Caulobacteraceae bacterium]|jgi:multidrug efflux system membrane fusion protein|nr:efflux transporter, family, subunit [Caulobacteraceae bacterium]